MVGDARQCLYVTGESLQIWGAVMTNRVSSGHTTRSELVHQRTVRELANEKWWHLWAQVALTFVGTVLVMLLLSRVL